VEPVFAAVARERGLPVRAADAAARDRLRRAGLRTPDAFLDGFFGTGATAGNLRAILEALPEGTSELMCHPGRADAELRRSSTYADERDLEVAVLCDPKIREIVRRRGIALRGFGDL
jgi:predicted glycoside hydrolase/deacetylase ChbG (UPF0249 family)